MKKHTRSVCKNQKYFASFLAMLLVFYFACVSDQYTGLPRILLGDGKNRMYTFTNKKSGFYLGNSHLQNSVGHDGWTVDEKHYLKDYILYINGHRVLRDSVLAFEYYPDFALRIYQNGLREKFTLLDSIDAILIEIYSESKPGEIAIEPLLHREISGKDLKISRNQPLVIVSPQEFLPGDHTSVYQWMGGAGYFEEDHTAKFVFVLGPNADVVEKNSTFILEHAALLSRQREQRLTDLIHRNNLYTSIPEITDAVTWAQISLDALVTEQRGKGIWAGLPWFNNYWGRDTFISFTGALLVNGNFGQARDILTAFARFQLLDENDSWYGRIPNRVTNQEIIYNTTDATWWFIRQVYEYVLYSGDQKFISEIFPVVKRAIEGALRYRIDKYFFLTHDDADTWMDAKGPSGPWSPRGNRAVEIQALWFTALQAGAHLALYTGNSNLADHWLAIAATLRRHFIQYFWNDFSYQMTDHLNADDTPDKKIRPNQIFAVFAPDLPGIEALIPSAVAARVSSTVIEKLTYRYGVASLAQEDVNFHPWHHYAPYYVPDEAYHNGLVWTWLAGPVISSINRFGYSDLAFQLYYNEAIQILFEEAIGNFSELLEALPRPNSAEPKISGTVSQAWSLAEFARNFYQDFVGFSPNALESLIIIEPAIPTDLSYISTRLYFRSDVFLFEYRYEESIHHLDLKRISGQDDLLIRMKFPGYPEQEIEFNHGFNSYSFVFFDEDRRSTVEFGQLNWFFAQPILMDNLIALRDPGYPVLRSAETYFSPSDDDPVVITATDPIGDDQGINGKYSYPLSFHFPAGIFDLIGFEVIDLGEDWGFILLFRELYNPNWHPEYGYQLTFTAVAIHYPNHIEKGKRQVGHGANYSLTADRAFHDILYIGGGFELQDSRGKVKARFIPDDKKFPLGFVDQKLVRFRISKSLLAEINPKTRFTILCGAQDDHGGAGFGEFRAVSESPGEWHGGGATQGNQSNRVYDILEIN